MPDRPIPYGLTKADMVSTAIIARAIGERARRTGERGGQALFNSLPGLVTDRLAGKLFDPFHKEMTDREIFEWIENHLIFDGVDIVALFNGNTILWEGRAFHEPTERNDNGN